jgi:hypothetical protein
VAKQALPDHAGKEDNRSLTGRRRRKSTPIVIIDPAAENIFQEMN